MKCPFCGHLDDKVVDSRSRRNGMAIKRRRECLECKSRFTTYEYIEEMPVMVRKKDGRTEQFDRNKLKRGILLSLVKRQISLETIEAVVREIEEKIFRIGKHDIDSREIGDLLMARLRELDEVAYIRFASVYRRFEDLGEFRRELEKCQ